MNAIIFVVMLLAGLVGGGQARDVVLGQGACSVNMEKNADGVCVCRTVLKGGYRSDGKVDQRDGGDWLDAYKSAGIPGAFNVGVDFNCDNKIDIRDGYLWYLAFKAPPPTPTPDPGTSPTPTCTPNLGESCLTDGDCCGGACYELGTEHYCCSDSSCTEVVLPTSIPQGRCESSGGQWVHFTGTCADKCVWSQCTDAAEDFKSCQCGDDKCWENNTCRPNILPSNTPTPTPTATPTPIRIGYPGACTSDAGCSSDNCDMTSGGICCVGTGSIDAGDSCSSDSGCCSGNCGGIGRCCYNKKGTAGCIF